MASSIMHLAVTGELAKKYAFKDLNRLRLGAILPDAGSRELSHFSKRIWGLNKKNYNFELYREKFGELMKTDDLYLGVYLHLVQDLCYRHFVYDKYSWNPMIPGNMEKLHNDYAILNHYVVSNYNLKNDLAVPERFDDEPICDICKFDVNWLAQSVEKQFAEEKDEETFFFTREMADEFIREAVAACEKELDALANGEAMIESYDTAWTNRTYSLLTTTLNTRDLGSYRIDGTENYTKLGRIWRSDVPDTPSDDDIAFIRNTGVTTIIDTRSSEEKEKRPHGLAKLDGFHYHELPIDEGSGLPDSVDAIPESYYNIAHCWNISVIFKTIAEAPYGVMFNCTAGKDRTGVISALILWLCGVRKSDIVFDYMRTKENSKARFKMLHENYPELDMDIVIPNENNMVSFMQLIEDNYGTVEDYFTGIGINSELQQKIRCKLL
ncbi:MAG: tyrosine-protein phosphatase [Butyrivibrio sp.]|nr:tyrosine-protein phosphatase [Butyrivibrio sp.]